MVSPEGDDAIVFLQDMCENTVNGTLLDEDIAELITADALDYYGKYQEPKKYVCIFKIGTSNAGISLCDIESILRRQSFRRIKSSL